MPTVAEMDVLLYLHVADLASVMHIPPYETDRLTVRTLRRLCAAIRQQHQANAAARRANGGTVDQL